MKLNTKLGAIYDTIRFFEIYFNYDFTKQDITNYQLDVDECLKYYAEVVKYKVEISTEIKPFFEFNGNIKSFLLDIFIDNIINISSINDLVILFEDKELILSKFIDYYFINVGDIDFNRSDINEIYIKKLYEMDFDGNLKVGITLSLCNYDYIKEILINLLINIHKCIEKIYLKNSKYIKEFKLRSTYLRILEEMALVSTFDNAVYCITLLHSYIVRWIGIDGDDYFLVFGNNYEKALEKQHKYMNVTYESITSMLAKDINIKLINIIREHKKINAAEIIRIFPTDYSRSSIYRLLNNLQIEKVIYISGRDGQNIYYSVNTDYFENARIVIDKYLLYYIDK